MHLEDYVQTLGADLAMWPQHWNQSLECLVEQLQRIVSDETFLRCAGDLAGAVKVVNCGFEQLERAAQDRVGFAAAVDRVARAIGRTARGEQQRVDAAEPKAANTREQLLARWEYYSTGLPLASLELRVAQRALRDGSRLRM